MLSLSCTVLGNASDEGALLKAFAKLCAKIKDMPVITQ